jgi:hypothetical protein
LINGGQWRIIIETYKLSYRCHFPPYKLDETFDF